MIIYRHLKAKDGKLLISRHRHDFVNYEDKEGNHYMLDGGYGGYYRRSPKGEIFEVSITDDFKVIREYFERYNQLEQRYIKLKDISDEWLTNIIDWYIEESEILDYLNVNHDIVLLFIKEKQYRNFQEI